MTQSTKWLWLSILAKYAEVGESHNTVLQHSILAQYAEEVGKSHNTVLEHSIFAQYAEEVGKSHNTVLTFALDWSDIVLMGPSDLLLLRRL
jgi:hypothetical protein